MEMIHYMLYFFIYIFRIFIWIFWSASVRLKCFYCLFKAVAVGKCKLRVFQENFQGSRLQLLSYFQAFQLNTVKELFIVYP